MDPLTVVAFNVPGPPQGKGRSRSTKSGRHYTPTKTRLYEQAIAQIALQARQTVGCHQPLTGPVKMVLTAIYAVPASFTKARKAAALSGQAMPTSKPDLSNIVKAIEDGCNGVVYVDDSQIVSIVSDKLYGAVPGVSVVIRPVNAEWR